LVRSIEGETRLLPDLPPGRKKKKSRRYPGKRRREGAHNWLLKKKSNGGPALRKVLLKEKKKIFCCSGEGKEETRPIPSRPGDVDKCHEEGGLITAGKKKRPWLGGLA